MFIKSFHKITNFTKSNKTEQKAKVNSYKKIARTEKWILKEFSWKSSIETHFSENTKFHPKKSVPIFLTILVINHKPKKYENLNELKLEKIQIKVFIFNILIEKFSKKFCNKIIGDLGKKHRFYRFF